MWRAKGRDDVDAERLEILPTEDDHHGKAFESGLAQCIDLTLVARQQPRDAEAIPTREPATESRRVGAETSALRGRKRT